LMIYNHNPLATHPDQQRMRAALMHEALFVAGSDVVMTDSMRYADVILPAASVFETDDVYGAYGHTWLQRGQAVIPLQGRRGPIPKFSGVWHGVSGWMIRLSRPRIPS
nr:molybdopterin-dependent oxidoreductase [Thiolinea sp.]